VLEEGRKRGKEERESEHDQDGAGSKGPCQLRR
jgi:hypothetical protein